MVMVAIFGVALSLVLKWFFGDAAVLWAEVGGALDIGMGAISAVVPFGGDASLFFVQKT